MAKAKAKVKAKVETKVKVKKVKVKISGAQKQPQTVTAAKAVASSVGRHHGQYMDMLLGNNVDYQGGYGRFTDNEVEDLLNQGVKPWESDAEDVLNALNGGDY